MRCSLVAALVLCGCLEGDDDTGDGAGDGAATDGGSDGAAPDDFSECSSADGDAAIVDSIRVDGDVLTVAVVYSGGCSAHEFAICWPDQAFAESEPVQAMLELWHDANGDSCEAALHEDLEFDLGPLRSAWTAAYGASSGTIVVRVGPLSAPYMF